MSAFDTELLHLFMWVVGGLLVVLTGLIAWVGKRVNDRIDKISDHLGTINSTLVSIDRDLRVEVGKTNTRVAVLEDRVEGVLYQLKHAQGG